MTTGSRRPELRRMRKASRWGCDRTCQADRRHMRHAGMRLCLAAQRLRSRRRIHSIYRP
jgi:hypothetical protein